MSSLRFNSESRRWELDAPAHVMLRAKRVFGKASSKSMGKLFLSDTIETARDLEWFAQRYPLEMDEGTTFYLEMRSSQHKEEEDIVAALLAGRRELPSFELAVPPRDYQKEAAAMALCTGGLLLSDEVGLGKTTSSICALTDPSTLPALVVTLTHLPTQWQRELNRFAPNLHTHILKKGTPYDLTAPKKGESQPQPFPDVVICNYAKLGRWAETLAPVVRSIILDECQELRTGACTTKYHAVKHIADNCRMRMGLSVGGDAMVECWGGVFGDGFVGPISEMVRLVSGNKMPAISLDGHRVWQTGGNVYARGWTGSSFAWKRVLSVVEHSNSGDTSAVCFGGHSTVLSSDHIVYRASEQGVVPISARELTSGSILVGDTGYAWSDGQQEVALDIARMSQSRSKSQVVVDLSGVTRKTIGVTPQQWQNFHKEAKYGPRLPAILFNRMRHLLPAPQWVYSSAGRRAFRCKPTVLASSWAYVLGFYLGDGWIDRNRTCFAVDAGHLDVLLYELKRLADVDLDPKVVKRRQSASYEVRLSNPFFADAVRLMTGGQQALSKEVPGSWIVSWSERSRRELLRGMIDSDGHVSRRNGRRYYSTSSSALALSLLSLLRSLSIAGGIYERKAVDGGTIYGRTIHGKRSFVVHWSMHAERGDNGGYRGARCKHKITSGAIMERRVRSVQSRKHDNNEKLYDLEMDGHPSFVADGVLVHNSATPIFNYGGEIWNVLNVIRPGALGTHAEFEREWGQHLGRDRLAIGDPRAFGTYARDAGLILRRTRRDVGRELPPLSNVPQHVDSDERVLESVEDSCAELARIILSQADQNRGEKWLASEDFSNKLRQATGIAKAWYVAEFVKMLVDAGEKVVLYGWHRACFAAGTTVLMYDGTLREVESVSVGDILMGPDSAGRRVLSLTRGHGPMYEVRPTKGASFVCSEQHQLRLRYHENKKVSYVTMTAGQFARLSDRSKRSYQLFRVPVNWKESSSPVPEPWLMGYWLGNGAANLKSFTIASPFSEVAEELKEIAGRHGLVVRSYRCSSSGPDSKLPCYLHRVTTGKMGRSSNWLKTTFRWYGLHHNKHIPLAYKVSTTQERRELLAGLIDSDGHVYHGNSNGTAEYATVRKSLADDVAFVARSLGLAAYVKSRRKKVCSGFRATPGTMYAVSIFGDLTQLPMRVKHKHPPARRTKKDPLVVGVSIERVDDASYFGFEVDGDHLFLLGDFTVVHNCHDIWMKRLEEHHPVLFTGSESAAQKQRSLEAFTKGDSKVLVMSLRSGAGVDGLQHCCRTVVYGELDWSPQVHVQCSGRVFRDGQPDPVIAYYLISDTGSDPIVSDVLGIKRQQSDGLLDPDRPVAEFVGVPKDHVARLATDYLARRGLPLQSEGVSIEVQRSSSATMCPGSVMTSSQEL